MGAHTKAGVAASREVLDALRRIVQVLRESSRRAEAQLGITGAQLFVLQKIGESPSQSLNDLATRTHTHQSSVSTVVARLVERGLVARQRSARDGRRLELVLTVNGRRLAAKNPGAAQDRLIDTIQTLTPPSRRRLASLLRRVVVGMDALERQPRMFFEHERRRNESKHA
jgi:DNA-binding MarR family transcriptional regulator